MSAGLPESGEEVHVASPISSDARCLPLDWYLLRRYPYSFLSTHARPLPCQRNKKPSSSLEDEGVSAFVVPPPFISCMARDLYRFIRLFSTNRTPHANGCVPRTATGTFREKPVHCLAQGVIAEDR